MIISHRIGSKAKATRPHGRGNPPGELFIYTYRLCKDHGAGIEGSEFFRRPPPGAMDCDRKKAAGRGCDRRLTQEFSLGAGNRAEGACGQPPLPIGKNTELPSASDIVLKAKDGTWVSPHHHLRFPFAASTTAPPPHPRIGLLSPTCKL